MQAHGPRCALAAVVLTSTLVTLLPACARAQGGLPPVPVPAQNPITESKRVLGKILFWEEQLSSDNTVACGTCHRPAGGGSDPRFGRHPGPDGIAPSPDDRIASPGIRRQDAGGTLIPDPIFGTNPQITERATPSSIVAQWAPSLFWDGRAAGQFRDPLTGSVLIPGGGALESQSLGPILSDVEMAHQLRSWGDVTGKLAGVTPLALATNFPADVAAALAPGVTYPALFEAAFGDTAITPSRIAFAIATYERTLVPDRSPWDRFVAGDPTALTPGQRQGWDFFRTSACGVCHAPPFFTDNSFRNVGLRPVNEDRGRQEVTGQFGDRGRFRVPTLRNVGLRRDLFHTGRIPDVPAALGFYANGAAQFPDNQDPLVQGGIPVPPVVRPALIDFLVNGLTDPRVAAETFPFDRPRLSSEAAASSVIAGNMPDGAITASPNPFRTTTTLSLAASGGATGGVRLQVFDVNGRMVRELGGEAGGAAGTIQAAWEGRDESGRDLASGVYFVRSFPGGGTSDGTRIVLMK